MAPGDPRAVETSAAVAETVSADDLLVAVARHPLAAEIKPRRLRRMAEVACRRLASVSVVMENLWDSHNVSAVIRTAEGLGLDAVHVVEEPNPYRRHAGILHGADRWLSVVQHGSLEAAFAVLRERGFLLCAADLGPGCVPVSELPVEGPVAIVLGTERAGLTEHARGIADMRFTVPMAGFTGSFNVSVSAAISLYDLTERRRRLLGVEGDLGQDEALARLESWLEATQKGGSLRARRAGGAGSSEPAGEED